MRSHAGAWERADEPSRTLGKYCHHAFISYAWADDQPFATAGGPDQHGTNRGWVSTFRDRYRKHLGREIGRIPEGERIWLDYEQLRGSDAVTPEIHDTLKDSALLIPILSKSWFASPWCRQEFTAFIQHHADWQKRLFPVWMEQVEPNKLDGAGQQIWDQFQELELLGYTFWYRNQANRVRTRWFPNPDPSDRDYGYIQQDMARDMAERLEALGQLAEDVPSPAPIPPPPSQPSATCDLPVPPFKGNQVVVINGGSHDAPLVQDIARVLNTRGGLSYRVPLMAKGRRVKCRPSKLRWNLRENLERATAVLMVFRAGSPDEVQAQLREYRQAVARHPERAPYLDICHLGNQPLDLPPSGPDIRVYPITDGNLERILEILPQPPAGEEIRHIIKGIIPSVSTKPDSTTTLRRMRDERTRQLSE